MNLFGTLRQKPWLDQSLATDPAALTAQPNSPARTAFWFLICVISILFFLFSITFLSRSQYPDFQALAGQPWQPFDDASRLWLNTGILLAASLSMQYALYNARRHQLNGLIYGLVLGTFFSVVFLLAQLILWQQLQAMGFYLSTNPANSYFYLLTAVHGLHLIGGLIALAHIVVRIWYNHSLGEVKAPLALCANYWHFLFAVWIVLFALLTSERETLNTLAALCGF